MLQSKLKTKICGTERGENKHICFADRLESSGRESVILHLWDNLGNNDLYLFASVSLRLLEGNMYIL